MNHPFQFPIIMDANVNAPSIQMNFHSRKHLSVLQHEILFCLLQLGAFPCGCEIAQGRMVVLQHELNHVEREWHNKIKQRKEYENKENRVFKSRRPIRSGGVCFLLYLDSIHMAMAFHFFSSSFCCVSAQQQQQQ